MTTRTDSTSQSNQPAFPHALLSDYDSAFIGLGVYPRLDRLDDGEKVYGGYIAATWRDGVNKGASDDFDIRFDAERESVLTLTSPWRDKPFFDGMFDCGADGVECLLVGLAEYNNVLNKGVSMSFAVPTNGVSSSTATVQVDTYVAGFNAPGITFVVGNDGSVVSEQVDNAGGLYERFGLRLFVEKGRLVVAASSDEVANTDALAYLLISAGILRHNYGTLRKVAVDAGLLALNPADYSV